MPPPLWPSLLCLHSRVHSAKESMCTPTASVPLHDKDGVLVGTVLLDMYAKGGHLLYARRVFEAMAVTNDVTWSTIIGGFVVCGRMPEAFSLFKDMLAQGLGFLSPTSVASALRASASLADVCIGKQLHVLLAKSWLHSDLTVGNSLLLMYAKAGLIDEATALFDEMATKDTVSYSALASGYVQNGMADAAFLVLRKMQSLQSRAGCRHNGVTHPSLCK